jgi:hypothetical protein
VGDAAPGAAPRTVQRERKRRRRYLPVARGDVEEAVSRGAQPQRTKARAHRRVRRGRTRSGPQASPAARALYLLLAIQPFPLRIAGGEEAAGDGTCGEPQEIAPVDHPFVRDRAIYVSTPMHPQGAVIPQRCLIEPTSRSTGKPSNLSRPQHMLGLALDLPDPLLRHPQFLGQLREGRSLFLVEAVPFH